MKKTAYTVYMDTYMHTNIHTYIRMYMHTSSTYIKISGSELQLRKVKLTSADKKHDDYREYFIRNNEAGKHPYETTLLH